MEPEFLSLEEVLEIHAEQIERYGGSPGLRDAALLDSAIAAPQASFNGDYLRTSIPAMAAAYLFSPFPKPSIHRWQQAGRSKRGDYLSADERLGTNVR
jgi:hypothetical protein